MRCAVLFGKSVAATLVCLLTISLSGCEPQQQFERVPVKGTVKLNGELLDQAIIWFEPLEGTQGPSSDTGINQGQYEITEESESKRLPTVNAIG